VFIHPASNTITTIRGHTRVGIFITRDYFKGTKNAFALRNTHGECIPRACTSTHRGERRTDKNANGLSLGIYVWETIWTHPENF
jgi:hypothetical protein